MGFQLKTSEWIENGWEFHWIQKIAYNAETLNDVTVSVNPCTGQVMDYNSCKVSVTAPNAPTITSQQAIDIAKQYVGIVQNLVVHTSPRLLVYPDGTLKWSMEISGTDAQDSDIAYGISVNAGIGAVTDAEQASYVGPMKPKDQKNINKITDMLEKCTAISIINKTSSSKQYKIKQGSKNFTATIKAVQSLLKSSKAITEKSLNSQTVKYEIWFYTGKDKAIEAKFDPGTGYFAITSQITLENKNGKERIASTEPIPAVIIKCPKEFVENMKSAIQSAANTPTKTISRKK
jgi:hypothetical protein